jgi:hypothetical protein
MSPVIDLEIPADAFDAIEEVKFYAEDMRETWEITRNPSPRYGDTLEITLDYVDPEGKRVGLADYARTFENDTYVLCFDLELPED